MILTRDEADRRRAESRAQAPAGGSGGQSAGESKSKGSRRGQTVRESGADLAHYGNLQQGTPGMSQILHTNSYAESQIEGLLSLHCCLLLYLIVGCLLIG